MKIARSIHQRDRARRHRSDRRASRRLAIAALLLRRGHNIFRVGHLTRVPIALLDLMREEQTQSSVATGS